MSSIPPLPKLPTKEQELAHYRAFVESLPRASYLRGILGNTIDAVADLIRDDMAFPEPLYAVWRSLTEGQEDLKALRAKLQEAQRQVDAAESAVSRKRGELRDLANAADLIGKQIRQAVPVSV